MTRQSISVLLLVAACVAAAACNRIDVPPDSAWRPREPSFRGSLDSASAADFTEWARAQEYSRFVGDSQRLALRPVGAPAGVAGLSYGPLAWIYPLKRLGSYFDKDFQRGRVIARIHASGEYRKLGLRSGENYLIVRRIPGGPWYAMMRYPGSDSVTYLDVEYESHAGDPEPPPETVRWLWNDRDEDLWGRCSSGCCRVIGFRDTGTGGG